MAVQKSISYIDKNGTLRSVFVSIELKKFAFGQGVDDEQVYLEVTAPGVSGDNTWRANIDKICEDGLWASGVSTRYQLPNNDLGEKFNADQTVTLNVSGVVRQLQVL